MMQVTMDLDPALEKRLAAIEDRQKQTIEVLTALKGLMTGEKNDGEWMSIPQFCKRYQISSSTLRRRAETGEIEVFEAGNIKRYRWREEPER